MSPNSDRLGWTRGGDPLAQPAPQLGLPAAVVLADDPGPDHVGPLNPVAIEQVRDVAHHPEAVRRILGTAPRALQVPVERGQPRIAQALVDHLE